jgi:enamine deaminase RidA (YjgF/YER057c/UK114 family)
MSCIPERLAWEQRCGKDGHVSALQHFRAPDGLAPGPGYSHAVTGRGRWVATAGQVALDENGKLVGPDDPEAQTRQVFANLSRALEAAGASFTDVIKLNYYVTDIAMLPVVRAIRESTSTPPVLRPARPSRSPRWPCPA